jgi:hypothetical protein
MLLSDPIKIPRFVFDIDQYNADRSYRDQMLRTMNTFDPANYGILSFVFENEEESIHITDPKPIKELITMVIKLFQMWESQEWQDHIASRNGEANAHKYE